MRALALRESFFHFLSYLKESLPFNYLFQPLFAFFSGFWFVPSCSSCLLNFSLHYLLLVFIESLDSQTLTLFVFFSLCLILWPHTICGLLITLMGKPIRVFFPSTFLLWSDR